MLNVIQPFTCLVCLMAVKKCFILLLILDNKYLILDEFIYKLFLFFFRIFFNHIPIHNYIFQVH